MPVPAQLRRLDVCDGSRLTTQLLTQHKPPPPLAPVPEITSLESDQRSNGSGVGSKLALPPRPAGKGAAANGLPASGGLPDFLAAALSAARSRSGSAQPQAATSGSGDRSGSGAAPQGGLPDLLGSLLAAARDGQQGAAIAGGDSSSSPGGMVGMLPAALAGGLREVANGSSGDTSSNAVLKGVMPSLPARRVKGPI